MAEFNIRTEAVDVEQIMRQIRARIREKRGVDYTEQQIQEMASVKLEQFLDAKGVRSDLVEQFRRTRTPSPPLPTAPNFAFESDTLFTTHRSLIRVIRWLLRPVLKLFFNPNPLSHVLHMQSQINDAQTQINDAQTQRFLVRDELDSLYYEVIHNLVLETTRLGIEVKNLKMRVESLSSRLDFDERRARALEGVVQYRPAATGARRAGATDTAGASAGAAADESPADPGEEAVATARRRRRRRRGRRGRSSTPPATGAGTAAQAAPPGDTGPEAREPMDEPSPPDADDGGPDDEPFSSDQ